jgi:predicted Zn-dependent peptidase
LAVALLMAAAVAVAVRAPLEAAVPPPRFQYETLTLDNGLRVILSEDHSTPIVHISVTYHVGSKDARAGRTGFAHLFAHMMFKGSVNVGPEAHGSYIAGVGGISNAYTTEDETVFWQTLPAHYLPLALWLEADRMATLRVDADDLAREIEVVKEERRMRIENQPYGRLTEVIYAHAFTAHPYRHPTSGRMEDLDAASIEDVRAFHDTYYVPANATVTIVGDFDTAQAADLVREYFGRVPAGDRDIPRNIPVEPPQTAEEFYEVYEPWPLPAVVVAYHITYDGHPDSYPLHIVSKILSDGESARITRNLVYDRRLALTAFGTGNLIEDPNLFYAVAIVQPGRTPEEVTDALIAEFDRMAAEPVSENELQTAKNQFARDYIVSRETNQEKALHLAHAEVIHDDITTADGEFDIFMSTTREDVQRVARTYFTANNRTVLHILPSGGAQ